MKKFISLMLVLSMLVIESVSALVTSEVSVSVKEVKAISSSTYTVEFSDGIVKSYIQNPKFVSGISTSVSFEYKGFKFNNTVIYKESNTTTTNSTPTTTVTAINKFDVTFSDGVTKGYVLDEDLIPNIEETVTVTYNKKNYSLKITYIPEEFSFSVDNVSAPKVIFIVRTSPTSYRVKFDDGVIMSCRYAFKTNSIEDVIYNYKDFEYTLKIPAFY